MVISTDSEGGPIVGLLLPWHNEGWIRWSLASSAFRTDEELATYGIDHADGTFPDFPLPLRDQIIGLEGTIEDRYIARKGTAIGKPRQCRWPLGHCPTCGIASWDCVQDDRHIGCLSIEELRGHWSHA